MNIETQKLSFPPSNLKKWTYSAIHCYLRGCICENCIYQEAIKSAECKMKVAVILLTKKYGRPTEEKIREYQEIEDGKRKYERKNPNTLNDRCNEKNSTKRTRKKKKVLSEMD